MDIHGLSSQGSGVGRLPDGRTVFVPRTAPGDRARVRLARVKRRWAEGVLVELLVPSPERREALCAIYSECGGCQLQHLPEDVQRGWKARFVSDALTRIGGMEGVEPPEVVASPEETRYRNRMSFTLRRLPHGRIVAGLHALGRPAHVVDIAGECVLPEPTILEAWVALRDAWGPGAELLPSGGRLRLTVRSDVHRGVALVVEGGPSGWDPAPILARMPKLAAAVHRPEAEEGTTGVECGLDTMERADDPQLGFEQVNAGAAELLRAHVVARAGTPATAVDAYCGAGPYGRALAEGGAAVVGIELDPAAAAHGRRDAPPGFTIREGAVEDLLPALLPTDLLIVNPPRTGVTPAVLEAVAAEPPRRIVYVSCDPATLARDLSAWKTRYTLEHVRCFDLFPQTAHVETVVDLKLVRND